MSLAAVKERAARDKEYWRYTSLAPLESRGFASAPIDPQAAASVAKVFLPSISANDSERHRFVFVDGVWRPELSSLGKLAGLMQGDAAQGYHLRCEGETCLVTAPVELVYLGAAAGAEISTRFTVTLGASGRLTLIEHFDTPRNAALHLRTMEIRLAPQAKLVHGKVIEGGAESSHILSTTVRAEAGAYYDNFNLLLGGEVLRDEINVRLEGVSAQSAVSGLMLLRGARHADTTLHIIHAAPDTSSRQFYKSALDEKARGVFQGKITVEPHAQKTDAQQLSRALLLSDRAEMDARPELKIYADDVTCSHGCAVGDIDADMLFYLRARGLDEQAARALLIRGFLDEVLEEIRVPEWRAYVHRRSGEWLHG